VQRRRNRAAGPGGGDRARATRQPAFADLRQNGESLRLVAWPFQADDGRLLVLELGGSHAAIEHSLRTSAFALLVIDLAALALLLVGSWVFSRRILVPIDRVARRVEEIDEANLAARVPGASEDNELGGS